MTRRRHRAGSTQDQRDRALEIMGRLARDEIHTVIRPLHQVTGIPAPAHRVAPEPHERPDHAVVKAELKVIGPERVAGVPYELVARQLGRAHVAMVAKVYGRFAPGHQDRERWEKVADARDREEFAALFRESIAGRGALDGALGPRGTSEVTRDEAGIRRGAQDLRE